jgi:hypothetical protein
MSPEDDIGRVAAEYGLDPSAALLVVRPFLAGYLELVFAEDSFEIITGGKGIADALARASGLGVARAAFLATERYFPGAMLGLKVAVGADTPPTLYHRSMLPVAVGVRHIETLLREAGTSVEGIPEETTAFDGVRTLYGLGFTEERAALRIKTYTLGSVDGVLGFRSLRMDARGFEKDVREYTPSAASNGVAAEHARRALGVEQFGHVARSRHRGTKVYVERVGAIATDYAAR